MTRYSFGGDEHVFVEFSAEMSLDSFFASLAMTEALRAAAIAGVSEICPANASLQVRFNPDIIAPDDVMARVQALEPAANTAPPTLSTRIIEVPVLYDDPWTRETLMRFRERHQDASATDLEYAARLNGFDSVAGFIAAHAGAPWFVSMVGFVAGLPFLYQMVPRDRQLEVPKYLRPRTDTPKLTIGHGGCFSCIYSVRGAGGYQMFGVTPMPIYDPAQQAAHLQDFMILFNPGDIVRFRAIDRAEYDATLAAVAAGSFQPKLRPVSFSLAAFQHDPDQYNRALLETLDGH